MRCRPFVCGRTLTSSSSTTTFSAQPWVLRPRTRGGPYSLPAEERADETHAPYGARRSFFVSISVPGCRTDAPPATVLSRFIRGSAELSQRHGAGRSENLGG